MNIPAHIWDFIKSWEGHDTITDDKDDTGGLTRWGVSQVNNPDVDVRNLSEFDAEQIFNERYYQASKADELPEYMQLVHTNCAVNCGVGTSAKILQKTIGVKADGKIGPQTLGAVRHYFKTPRYFTGWYLTWQALYYFNIVERRKSQHKWLKGWVRRTIDAAWITAVNFGKRTT